MKLHPLFAVAAALCSCSGNVNGNIPIIDKALSDEGSVHYADFKSYPSNLKDLPIGVFDSGTGGLTVLERILSMDGYGNGTAVASPDGVPDFRSESFVYLADQANMPYGQYDARGKKDYLRELVVGDALFLLKNPGVKIIVIACNTATAYGLADVASLLRQSGTGIKVIGVINAGAGATLDCLQDFEGASAIGVLATPGTISSGAYERTLLEEASKRGMKVEVVSQSGYGFAESVDSEPQYVLPDATGIREDYLGPSFGTEDKDLKRELLPAYNFDKDDILFETDSKGNLTALQLNSAAAYARFNLVSLLEKHRAAGSRTPMRAIILGCTHYPFLLDTMKAALGELREYRLSDGTFPYRDLIAENMIFIDPAINTADECYRMLVEDGNLVTEDREPSVSAYISVPAEGLPAEALTEQGAFTYEFKYGRNPGTEDITFTREPFSKDNVSETNRERLEKLVPISYSLIKGLQ